MTDANQVGDPVAGDLGAAPPAAEALEGVRGWLLVLCAVFVASPVLLAWDVWSDIAAYGDYLTWLQPMRVLFFIELAAWIPAATLAFYAGIRLWTRKPGAVRAAKAALLAYVVAAVVDAMSPFLVGFSSTFTRPLLSGAVREVLVKAVAAGIVWAYLARSKRVQATYATTRS